MIRAVILPEPPGFYANCLEHDIGAYAPDLATLRKRLELTIATEKMVAVHLGKSFSDIRPAPQHFFDLWDKQGGWEIAA